MKITIDFLKELSHRLMFEMKAEEYETLKKEFDILLSQFELIEEIEGIDKLEPMTFPYLLENYSLREDIPEESLKEEDVFKNVKELDGKHIKIGKVVK
ncbi:MAG: aspartyl/glutamyl-tRNA amidotransferase subunit C [Bacillales bacterium]|nr:aspartyl/glutamyl-tRNA amidotransferase subunit C [Bacillales bacterium]